MALSSTEAEYIALVATIQEGTWLTQLTDELNIGLIEPMLVYCDNQSTIKLAESEAYRKRTKHIDIKFQYIREKVMKKQVQINFVGTEKNIADALTKAVTKNKLNYCAQQMGLN